MDQMRGYLMWAGMQVRALAESVGDDEAVLRFVMRSNDGQPFINSRAAAKFAVDMKFALDWARLGFPTVTLGHKLIASFMATSVGPDAVGDVVFPWPTFVVVVPPGIATVPSATDGEAWDVKTIRVTDTRWNGSGYSISIKGDSDAMIVANVDSPRDLTTLADPGYVEYSGAASPEEASAITDQSSRIARLMWRLLLGVCVELDQPKHRVEISNGPPPVKAKMVKRGEPQSWSFNLTREVKVDCREWVTSYLSGRSGPKASVQSLIRGHHKRQPYGQNSSLRKWIHVEPYWRGPEDAPIAVRSHVLEGRAQ